MDIAHLQLFLRPPVQRNDTNIRHSGFCSRGAGEYVRRLHAKPWDRPCQRGLNVRQIGRGRRRRLRTKIVVRYATVLELQLHFRVRNSRTAVRIQFTQNFRSKFEPTPSSFRLYHHRESKDLTGQYPE